MASSSLVKSFHRELHKPEGRDALPSTLTRSIKHAVAVAAAHAGVNPMTQAILVIDAVLVPVPSEGVDTDTRSLLQITAG